MVLTLEPAALSRSKDLRASGWGARARVMGTAPSGNSDRVREAARRQRERLSPGSGDLRSGFPHARRLAAATPARWTAEERSLAWSSFASAEAGQVKTQCCLGRVGH